MTNGKPTSGSPAPTPTAKAEEVAIAGLGFIAGDEILLRRFLALTGIEVSAIRIAAQSPGFLGEVLAFILAHEPTLARFSAESGIEPLLAAGAHRTLCGGRGEEWYSV